MLRQIEHKIESLFEGVFGRAFRTHVQPVELARKLAKEMDDGKTVSVSRVYVPNEYSIYLAVDDRAQFEGYEPSLVDELQQYLAEHARREQYALLSPPKVILETDEDLAVGEFGIATRMAEPSGKAADKAALQRELGLAVDPNALLTAAIGRLAHQKGYDLIARALPQMTARNVQFVMLGTGDAALEEDFRAAAAKHPQRISAQIKFDDGLAHRIEGGADVFLMPSRFEPCGLNQLYSLRYGTLPLVHAVGGLADSIKDAAPKGQKPGQDGWGFRFEVEEPAALLDAIDRALLLWNDKPAWRATMDRAMARDHSWDRAAGQYEALYKG